MLQKKVIVHGNLSGSLFLFCPVPTCTKDPIKIKKQESFLLRSRVRMSEISLANIRHLRSGNYVFLFSLDENEPVKMSLIKAIEKISQKIREYFSKHLHFILH